MAFLGSLIQYVVILVILAAIAAGGIFLGRFLRNKKDAKAEAEAFDETKE